MVLPIVTACMPILVGVIDAFQAYWSARDDPTWETRWRGLYPAERSWLAVVATRRDWIASLSDLEEIRLAKGRKRHETRRYVNFDLAALPLFIAAAALVLIGVLGEGVLLSVFFAFTLIRGVWSYRRERQIKGELEAQRQVAAAVAS